MEKDNGFRAVMVKREDKERFLNWIKKKNLRKHEAFKVLMDFVEKLDEQ
jgi:hypothetical protein